MVMRRSEFDSEQITGFAQQRRDGRHRHAAAGAVGGLIDGTGWLQKVGLRARHERSPPSELGSSSSPPDQPMRCSNL